MSPLVPHPIGIKYWTGIWRECKDKPFSVCHNNFQQYYNSAFYSKFGRYYYRHRAGRMGAFAPIVVGTFAIKVRSMGAFAPIVVGTFAIKVSMGAFAPIVVGTFAIKVRRSREAINFKVRRSTEESVLF